MAFVLITFVVSLLVVVGAYWVFIVRPEEQAQSVIWRRLKSKGATKKTTTALLKNVQQLSNVPAFDAVLTRSRSGLRPLEEAWPGGERPAALARLKYGVTADIVGYEKTDGRVSRVFTTEFGFRQASRAAFDPTKMFAGAVAVPR